MSTATRKNRPSRPVTLQASFLRKVRAMTDAQLEDGIDIYSDAVGPTLVAIREAYMAELYRRAGGL
jgi:hypothetical protein